MAKRAQERCLSVLEIDRVVRHRLHATGSVRSLEAHIDVCDACASRLARTIREEERFLVELLPRTVHHLGVRHDTGNSRSREGPGLRPVAAGVLAIAAGIVVVALLWTGAPSEGPRRADTVAGSEEPGGYLGLKGGPVLDLYVQRDGRVQPYRQGQGLLADDRLRLVPGGTGYRYILLFYRDATGAVQVVYPWDGVESGPLPPDGEPLDGSLVLQRADGREHVIGIFSVDPLPAARFIPEIEEAPDSQGGLNLPAIDGAAAVVVPLERSSP